jgi:hypothetical protein
MDKADDPCCSVGEVVEATETCDGLAITGRFDRDTEFGKSDYRNTKGRKGSGLRDTCGLNVDHGHICPACFYPAVSYALTCRRRFGGDVALRRRPLGVWASCGAEVRGKVISALMTVTVLPAARGPKPGGGYFDPQSVQIDWKHCT